VDVLDCGLDTERECAFIVMDQYDGTLLQFINQVTSDERMRHVPCVCGQLLITMASLDRKRMAHRDVKPSNILVQRAPVHGHEFSHCACSRDRSTADDATPTGGGNGRSADDSDETRRFDECMRLFSPLVQDQRPASAHAWQNDN